MLTRMI